MRYWSLSLLLLFMTVNAFSEARYGAWLCKQPGYHCLIVQSVDSWESLFPDESVQSLLQRINRMNIPLKRGMMLAIPDNLEGMSIYDFSPFPRYIDSNGEKMVYISQKLLAWAAYDEQGELTWWGPISSGIGPKCRAPGACETPSGLFRIIRKQDENCISTAFPRRYNGESGGAEMPYCMHFFRGYALHGSDEVPGYRASHGCIRLFNEDAQWLNEEFIELPGAGGLKGTRILIEGITG